jgi:hypothetical protein
LLRPEDFLSDFPGLKHIYLRSDWSHLEPAEGQYQWDLIDRVIAPWTARGYRVSFRICCKETSPGRGDVNAVLMTGPDRIEPRGVRKAERRIDVWEILLASRFRFDRLAQKVERRKSDAGRAERSVQLNTEQPDDASLNSRA